LRIAHIPQIARTQEAQIRLLRQVLDIDVGPYPPADKPQEVPIPALSPAKKKRAV
jgi:hypothetical protein